MGGNAGNNGIGIDSTSANSAQVFTEISNSGITNYAQATYMGYPGIGIHTITWLEAARAGTATFVGDNGLPTNQQYGMHLQLRG